MARPSLFSDELAGRICEELMLGRSLRKICETEEWAPNIRTVTRWLDQDVEGFVLRYARARAVQADIGADDIQDIADTPEIGEIETDKLDKDGNDFTEVRRADMIEHRKLRIDVRKWNAEKLRPKVYGAKQTIEHQGGIAITSDNSDELMAEILDMLATGRVKLPDGIQIAESDEEPEEDDYSDIA